MVNCDPFNSKQMYWFYLKQIYILFLLFSCRVQGNMIKDQVINVQKLYTYIIKYCFPSCADALFEVIMALVSKGCNFHLSVLGQQFSEQPEIFRQAKEKLENEASSQCKILNWGYMSSKEKYLEVLSSAHVVGMMLSIFGYCTIEEIYTNFILFYTCSVYCSTRVLWSINVMYNLK